MASSLAVGPRSGPLLAQRSGSEIFRNFLLFKPDFSKLTADSVLAAMGDAFFTLSLGMGAITVYSSNLNQGVSIVRTSLFIAAADSVVALLAGLAIFPIVMSHRLWRRRMDAGNRYCIVLQPLV